MAKEKKGDGSKIRIKLRGYDHKLLDQSARDIVKVAKRHDVAVKGPIPLPTRIHKYSVKRSSFVHEDSHEQFETRVHKRLIDILQPSKKVIGDLQDLDIPAGVDISIQV